LECYAEYVYFLGRIVAAALPSSRSEFMAQVAHYCRYTLFISSTIMRLDKADTLRWERWWVEGI
jgi:hypothetical protein